MEEEYKISKKVLFVQNRILAPVLRIFWEPFSKKKSHWWHWKDCRIDSVNKEWCVELPGDPEAKPRTGLWSSIWQTNFGWKKAVVLSATQIEAFEVGFMSCEGTCQICTLTIAPGETVAMLRGPQPFYVFAVGKDGKQIPLQITAKKYKHELTDEKLI